MNWKVFNSYKLKNKRDNDPDYKLLIRFENGPFCDYSLWNGTNGIFKLELEDSKYNVDPPIEITIEDLLKDKRYRIRILSGSENL